MINPSSNSKILTIIFLLVVLLYFGLAVKSMAGTPTTLENGLYLGLESSGEGGATFSQYASRVLKFGIITGALLAVVMIVISGFKYITAAGDTGKIEDAKDKIWQALIGLLVIVGSYLLLNTINPDLLNMDLGITPLEMRQPAPTPPRGIPLQNTTKIGTSENTGATTYITNQDFTDIQICRDFAKTTCEKAGIRSITAKIEANKCRFVCK